MKRITLTAAVVLCSLSMMAQKSVIDEKFTPFYTTEQAPHMEMISYGPTLDNVHSPQERCHIPAVQKAWDFTVALLQAIACEK